MAWRTVPKAQTCMRLPNAQAWPSTHALASRGARTRSTAACVAHCFARQCSLARLRGGERCPAGIGSNGASAREELGNVANHQRQARGSSILQDAARSGRPPAIPGGPIHVCTSSTAVLHASHSHLSHHCTACLGRALPVRLLHVPASSVPATRQLVIFIAMRTLSKNA